MLSPDLRGQGTAAVVGLDGRQPRACLVDIQGAGPRAVEMRRLVYERFVNQMRALRNGRRDGRGEIPQVQVQAAVGAIGELVQERILLLSANSARRGRSYNRTV